MSAHAPQPPQARQGRTAEALARFHEEDRLGSSQDRRALRRLWPFVRPHKGPLGLSLGLLLANAALATSRPLLMREALDLFREPGAEGRLGQAGLTLGLVMLLEQALSFPQLYAMQLAGARAMGALREAVFAFLHTRSLGYFDRTPVGRLVTRVTNDVDAVAEMFSSGALNAVGDLARLLAIVVILLRLDWRLSLLAFATLPPVGLFVQWTRKRIREAFREVRTKTARMNAYLNEQVSGMSVVQAYARDRQAAAEFDAINTAYRAANNRSITFDASLDAAIEMVGSLCIASVLWYAGVRIGSGEAATSFGTLFAFVAYLEMFFVPIRDLSSRYTLVQSAMAGAERIFELLDNREEDAPSSARAASEADRAPRPGAPCFELDHVDFAYKQGSPVLHDVCLAVRQGERVALVGATGAGKSTIASLLLRLYEASSGVVRVEGVDVRDLPRAELRKRFAVVPQDVFLFPGTVASNVSAGDPDPDRARVEQALARIGALELFQGRPGGLDAPVAERGSNFSAGERQLLAFARALYRDPPVLVLDEATASIDSHTEARLQSAMQAATAGRTALIIAHRLSTLRDVSRIVVFHKGRIAEQGTHEELLRADGLYARLHRLQAARERLGSSAGLASAEESSAPA